MQIYIVNDGNVEIGTFDSFENNTVKYVKNGLVQEEHIRNVFFDEKNARRHNLRSHGVLRPILNGTSHSQETK